MKPKLVVAKVCDDEIIPGQLKTTDRSSQRGHDFFLNRPSYPSCVVPLVKSAIQQLFKRTRGDLQLNPRLDQESSLDLRAFHVHDLVNVFFGQRVEDNNLVETVQKFRRELRPGRAQALVFNRLCVILFLVTKSQPIVCRDLACADIRRHQDNSVLEVRPAVVPECNRSPVKNAEYKFSDIT